LVANASSKTLIEEAPQQSKRERARAIPISWVERISNLKSKLDRILELGFNNDPAFESTITTSLTKLVNSNPKAAEYSNIFIEDVLKRAAKGVSDFEAPISRGISLFKYVGEKDMFERLYRQHLARRLLNLKIVNSEAENSMLEQMKVP
jgi:cullin 3